AGTELAGAYKQYRHHRGYCPLLILPVLAKFTSRGISSFTRRCWVRLSPIAQNSQIGAYKQYRHHRGYCPLLILPVLAKFTSRGISSFTRRCWVRLSPIAQNSRLLPPVGV